MSDRDAREPESDQIERKRWKLESQIRHLVLGIGHFDPKTRGMNGWETEIDIKRIPSPASGRRDGRYFLYSITQGELQLTNQIAANRRLTVFHIEEV